MHHTWRTQKDFMDDIWAISEMEGATRHEVEEPPPATILEYRAQMAANNSGSIYDNPGVEDEGVTYIISGRGRGGISTILRPGVSSLSDSLITEEVQKKLREVSGLGYSNELIEQSVRSMTLSNKDCPTPTKQTPLQPASTSKTSSPCRTSGSHSSLGNELSSSSCSSSSLSSNSLRHAQAEDTGATSSVTATGASPIATATAVSNASPVVNGAPPPLSVMRRRAQEQRAQEQRTREEKENNQPKASEVALKETKKIEKPSKRNSPKSPRNTTSWHNTSGSSSSSDEMGSWRRRDRNSPNRFFQTKTTGFNLNVNDFPALK